MRSGAGRLSGRPALVWFRNDLRLADHPALTAACASGAPLLCLYVQDEVSEGLRPRGAASRWRLDLALHELEQDLRAIGGRLDILAGPAEDLIVELARAADVENIFWNRRYAGGEIALDTRLKARLREEGRNVTSFNGSLLAEPWRIKSKSGGAFKVFTPFWRSFRENLLLAAPLPAPKAISAAEWPDKAPQPLPRAALRLAPQRLDWARDFPDAAPGEKGAQQRLRHFVAQGLDGYGAMRDRLDVEGTSGLSAHLHFGEISPRQIVAAIAESGGAALPGPAAKPPADADKFLSEIGWREFNANLLYQNPHLHWVNFNKAFDAFPFRDDAAALKAWQCGQTGYPVVDAAMRELWQTGFMHNRARMITASFLTKHLLLDWRQGESWFWDTLADADLANNAGGWQWVAGCGADAAPYFRIFNPVLQGEKFDPMGDYVRKFCPELAALPSSLIQKPWTAGAAILAQYGVRLGQTYPLPIVEHDFARRRALAALQSLRDSG